MIQQGKTDAPRASNSQKLRGRVLKGALALALALAVPATASAATFNVNTTTDLISGTPAAPGTTCANAVPGQCSLREAVIESNHTPGPNTINVPAGTYTLTLTGPKSEGGPSDADPNIPNSFSSQYNELDIENQNVSIVGAGAASTIIQAATTDTASQNMIFIVNGYVSSEPAPLNVTISGLTMRFGRNPYNCCVGGQWGFGGALEWESGNGGHLTLSNDTFDDNAPAAPIDPTTKTGPGDGGAVAGFNDSTDTTPSVLTVTNSTFTNNVSPTHEGGGVFTGNTLALSVSGSSFSNNKAANGGGVFGFGFAAGTPAPAGTPANTITNSTFTDNTATAGGSGGGVSFNNGVSISGSTFTGNTAGVGGGFENGSGAATSTVTGSTFTGNSATSTNGPTSAAGGGAIGNGNGILNVTDSRITGNTTAQSGTGSGIDQGPDNTTDRVTATDDWWGCNGGPGQPGCDTVADRSIGTHSFTTTPFVRLTTTGSPTTVLEGGSSSLTTSFLKDSAGTTLTTSQISELIGLPVSWTNTFHGAFSNQQSTIQSNGTATATLTNDGTCNNTSGQSKVDNVQTGDSLATFTQTVQCPDLTAVKTDNVGGTTLLGTTFNWKVHVANGGQAAANFASGQTILQDDLPSTGVTYGAASIANQAGITGTVTCSINASDTLTCVASGGPVSIAAGTGAFDVSTTATPSQAGSFANPRPGGSCAVDPANVISESNEANNGCSDTVVVTAPDLTVSKSDNVSNATTLGNTWKWTLHVANGGNGDATFASGDTVVSDDLPTANVAYSGVTTPSVANLSCSIASGTLSCTASGGPVTIAHGASFDVSVTATPSATGTFTNPTTPGSCSVDPGGNVTESNEANNACNSDSVVVTAPDLTATKSDDAPGGTVAVHNSFNWKIHVANAGSAPASFASGQTVVHDDLPSGAAYGTPSVSPAVSNLACAIASNVLTCTASGGSASIPAGGSFDVSFSVTPSVAGLITNPASGGTCSADPDNHVVESDETNNACNSDSVNVTGADLTATKTDDVSGATTLGNSWTWKIHVANGGVSDATFTDGQTVLSDDLPSSGVSYGTVSDPGVPNMVCSIDSGTSTLTCKASGGAVTVPASGGFDVSFTATPSTTGSFANPRTSGTCAADPANVVTEIDETNNACSDTVVVTAPDLTVSKSNDVSGATTLGNPWKWTLHVANGGSGDATFADGQTVLSDDLPTSNVAYSGLTTPSVANLSCAIASGTLSCTASGGPVTIAHGSSFDVSVTATPSATGTFTNPTTSGSCSVDPGGVVTETNESNNACNSDSVVVTAPDLTATKTDDAPGQTVTVHDSFNWKIHVANGGDATATFAAGQNLLHDDLPAGASYGTPSISNAGSVGGSGTLGCSISSGVLACAPSGGTSTLPAGASFDVTFSVTPSVAGTLSNPASSGTCAADPDNHVVESDESNNSCSDSVTVTGADLTATKTDDAGGATTLGNSWAWKIHVANQGVSDATFTDGQTVLSDDLPASGVSYGTPSDPGVTNLVCSISAGDTLTCKASGGPVTIPANTGAFDVSFTATPSTAGSFANPRSGGTCSVDPANVVPEIDETNNACSDTVVVSAPDLSATKTDDTGGQATLGSAFNWKLHVANGGSADATFASGQTILQDDLPSGASYGSPGVSNASGLTGGGSVSCAVAAGTLKCTASGGSVTIPTGQAFDVSLPVTPTQVGTLSNPRSGGTCGVDPNGVIAEANLANNTCSDSVTVTGPDLTATKTDDVGGSVALGGHFTWKVHVANPGSADATFTPGETVLRDDLPNANIAYSSLSTPSVTNLSCSIDASDTLTCVASGGSVTVPSGGGFDVSLQATPSAAGTFANPRSGGTCAVDPGSSITESNEANNSCSDTVTVPAPDLTASKTNNVGGSVPLGHSWTWTIHVANAGNADASFASGQRILVDDLPSSSVAYGAATVANSAGLSGSGSPSCSIDSTTDTLTCTASGGSVTLAGGTGAFDVSFQATPSAGGPFANPRSGGTCAVDPDAHVTESSTANNACQNTVIVGSAPTVSLFSPADGAHYNLGQHVLASFSCHEGQGGPGLQSCVGTVPNGQAIDTSHVGTHTFTVTATSKDGLSTKVTHTYTVVGPPTATISQPPSGQTYQRRQRVSTTFSCLEASGGPGLASCRDSNGASAPHGLLDTSHTGTFTYTVTAISRDGQRGTAHITYRVKASDGDERFAVSNIKIQRDGMVAFSTRTSAPGHIDVLETAWKSDELEPHVIKHTVLLQPAPHRFVFARAQAFVPQGRSTHLVRPNSRGSRLIHHHRYTVRIRLWVTFTPTQGAPRSQGFYRLFVTH